MGFGLLSYSREPLLEGHDVPENSVKPTGQGTIGGLHQYSITESKKCECCEDCPDCACEDCKVDKDFHQGGPGDDFALGYPMQAGKEEETDAEPPWAPWETPQPASPLDEFRRLAGMGGNDASYLPSPMSTGNRNVYSAGTRGILDAGPEPVEEAAKQSSLGKAPAANEEFFGEADPAKDAPEKDAPENEKPGRTAGRATRSRKDGVPRAGKQMRSEIAAAVRKLKAKYGLPRDTGWKAPPAPKPEPPEDKN